MDLKTKRSLGIAKDHIFTGAMFLKDKRYMGVRRLARYLGVTSNRAAHVLIILGWIRHSKVGNSHPVYKR